MIGLPIIWRLQTLAFAALALAGFGTIECIPAEDIQQNLPFSSLMPLISRRLRDGSRIKLGNSRAN